MKVSGKMVNETEMVPITTSMAVAMKANSKMAAITEKGYFIAQMAIVMKGVLKTEMRMGRELFILMKVFKLPMNIKMESRFLNS